MNLSANSQQLEYEYKVAMDDMLEKESKEKLPMHKIHELEKELKDSRYIQINYMTKKIVCQPTLAALFLFLRCLCRSST